MKTKKPKLILTPGQLAGVIEVFKKTGKISDDNLEPLIEFYTRLVKDLEILGLSFKDAWIAVAEELYKLLEIRLARMKTINKQIDL